LSDWKEFPGANLAMWLPGPIYESLPYLYTVGGVLFISGTLYVGVTSNSAALYIACGLISIIYGTFIFKMRQDARQRSNRSGTIGGA
jgi:hypothetical protein